MTFPLTRNKPSGSFGDCLLNAVEGAEERTRAARIGKRLTADFTGPAWREYLKTMPDDGDCNAGLLARDIYPEDKE